MSIHRPPTSDTERLENLLAAWGSPDDDAFEDDDEDLSGIDFDAWAAEIRAKVRAHAEAERPARAAAAAAETASPEDAAFEALVRAEVERSVAPYVALAPPVVLAKLRELAERYVREHPQASRILRMQVDNQHRVISGERPIAPEEEEQTARRSRKA